MMYEVLTMTTQDSIGGTAYEAAIVWVKKYLRYAVQKWPHAEPRAYVNYTGPIGQIHLGMRFESLAAKAAIEQEVDNDAGLRKLLEELMATEKKHGLPFLTRWTRSLYSIVEP